MGALACFDGCFLAKRLVLLLDGLLEIEILVAALLGFVDDGLSLAITAMAIDKERVAALASENRGCFKLLHRDFLLKTCRMVRRYRMVTCHSYYLEEEPSLGMRLR